MSPMRQWGDCSLNVPPPPGRSETATVLPRQGLDLYEQSVERISRMARKADELLRAAPRRETTGSRDLRALRRRLLDKGVPTGPDVTTTQVREARAAMAKELREAARAAGIDASAIREAARPLAQKLKSALGAEVEGSGRLRVVPEAEVPEPIRTQKTNPWLVKGPPYDGAETHWSAADNGFYDPSFTPYTYNSNGSVGQRTAWSISSADDFNYALLYATSLVGFWIQPQSPGQIEIWLKARCGSARYVFDGYDEWGWSEYWQRHTNYWGVGVSSSTDLDEQYSWGTYFAGPDEEYDYAAAHNFEPNSVQWLYFKTSEALAAGSWYYLRFGLNHEHSLYSNDETIYAMAKNRWYLESTQWRTVGT